MNKQKIELIVTVTLAILFLMILLSTCSRVSKKPKPVKITQEVTQRKISKDIRKPLERERRSTALTWGRDPFVLVEMGSVDKDTSLVLGGIIWHRNQPKAVINDEIYKIGDKIGDIQIVDIKKNSIVIEENNQTREITLY